MRLLAVLLIFAALTAGQGSPQAEWVPLFDGKSLNGWRETGFTRHGTPEVRDGMIVLRPGGPMTGVTHTGTFPKSNYEVRFEAQRIKGGDFFASLTFPVRDSFCTWVTGGWGGDIVGLSSIDGWDASDNETRTYFNFENRPMVLLPRAGDRRAHPGMDRREADRSTCRSEAGRSGCATAR